MLQLQCKGTRASSRERRLATTKETCAAKQNQASTMHPPPLDGAWQQTLRLNRERMICSLPKEWSDKIPRMYGSATSQLPAAGADWPSRQVHESTERNIVLCVEVCVAGGCVSSGKRRERPLPTSERCTASDGGRGLWRYGVSTRLCETRVQ